MPNTREKLIELCEKALNYDGTGREIRFTGGDVTPCLIANGVTVQEWIPVTERLPEKWQTVVVRVHFPFDENARMAVTPYNPDYNPHFWERVTHWMPLPEPPKGE